MSLVCKNHKQQTKQKKTQTNYFRTCTWATCCYFLILICSWNGFHVVIYLIVDAYACQPIRVWAYWIVFQWVNYRYWTQCLNLAEKYLSKIAFNHTLKWCYKWFGLVFHFQKCSMTIYTVFYTILSPLIALIFGKWNLIHFSFE